MGRDGYISIAILTSLVGLMVAVDSSAAVATRWIGGSVCVVTILVTAYLLAIPEALRAVFRRGALLLGSKDIAGLTTERREDSLVRFLRLHGHVPRQTDRAISLSRKRKVPDAG